MATPKKPAGKTYTLKIPRPQYVRLSDACNLIFCLRSTCQLAILVPMLAPNPLRVDQIPSYDCLLVYRPRQISL